MKIKCPACSKVLAIPDSAAGKVVKCPCGKQLRAPSAAPATGAAPASKPAGTAPTARPPGTSPTAAPRTAPARPQPAAGQIDPDIFDELTAQDLKPVKGVTNPYSPPPAPSAGGGKLLSQYAPQGGTGSGRREIAGVGSRIAGALIDGLFMLAFIAVAVGIGIAVVASSDGEPSPTIGIVFVVLYGFALLVPAVINAVLIAKSGQSIGKKVVKTRIVDQHTGAPAGLQQGFIVRSFCFGFLTGLPVVGGIIAIADIIYLFLENHQTLHDKLAGTLVVKA